MFSPEKGAETLLSFDQQRAGKKNRCTVSGLTVKLSVRNSGWPTDVRLTVIPLDELSRVE